MKTALVTTLFLCSLCVVHAQIPSPLPKGTEVRPAVPIPVLKPKRPKAKKLVARSIRLPVIFEENVGQWKPPVRYVVAKPQYTAHWLDGSLVLSLAPGSRRPAQAADTIQKSGPDRPSGHSEKNSTLTMSFPGGTKVRPTSEKALTAKGTFVGKQVTPYRLAASVVMKGIYPGVDARFYDASGRIRYDLVLAAGAKSSDIKLRFEGATSLAVDGAGNLKISTPTGTVTHSAPKVRAEMGGKARPISGRFILLSAAEVGIKLGNTKPEERVIIDPEISYSTYLGGENSEFSPDVDAAGSFADVMVRTLSSDFTVLPSGGGFSTYLLRFDCSDPAAPQLRSVVRGVGSLSDCQTLGDGSVLALFGRSITAPALQLPGDAFDTASEAHLLVRIGQDGTMLRATYFPLEIRAIAVDTSLSNGGVWVCGTEVSPALPAPITVSPVRNHSGAVDVFVAKLTLNMDRMEWFTWVGGSADDYLGFPPALTVRNGEVLLPGVSQSTDFPVTLGSLQLPSPPPPPAEVDQRAFLTRLDAIGAVMSSSLFGSGFSLSEPEDVAFASDGSQLLALTFSMAQSTTGVTGNYHGYLGDIDRIFRISPSGGALVQDLRPFPPADLGTLSPDGTGGMWMGSRSFTAGFATTDAIQSSLRGDTDGAVFHYTAAGTRDYLTYLGGSDRDEVSDTAHASNLVHAVGNTSSTDFTVSDTALQPVTAGQVDSFYTIIREAVPAFAVTKTASPAVIPINGQSTCTITVTNVGDAAGSFDLRDTADQTGLALLTTPPWHPEGADSAGTNGNTLQPGASASFTINVAGISPGVFANAAQVLAPDGTIVASASTTITVTQVAPPPQLLITVADDGGGTSPEGVAFHLAVTLQNLGTSPISNITLTHEVTQGGSSFANIIAAPQRTFVDPDTGLSIVNAAGDPVTNPATGNPVRIRRYQIRIPEILPGPAQAARVFVTTQESLKQGEIRTQATATVQSVPGEAYQATSITRIGQPVSADMNVNARMPMATDTPAPAGYQQVFVDVSRTGTGAPLPSFQLVAQITVPEGSRFPRDVDLTPTPLDDNNAFSGTSDNDGVAGSRFLFMVGAEGQAHTSFAKAFNDGDPATDTWIASFNVVNPGALPDSARILMPAGVAWRRVEAFIAPGPIIDPNGMQSILQAP